MANNIVNDKSYRDLYEDYHREGFLDSRGGNNFQGDKVLETWSNKISMLDFGCGTGYAVRRMRQLGLESCFGIEYSEEAFEKYLHEPYFFQGTTQQFDDRSFDLIYSTEVFEHIPEEHVDEVVGDLCRVCSSWFFLTISLRPSSRNNAFHCTLRPRSWWEAVFKRHGFVVDRQVVSSYQRRTLRTTSEILSQWSRHGEFTSDFSASPPYSLAGETQPWIFVFRRKGLRATRVRQYRQSLKRRMLLPLLRSLFLRW